MLLGILIAAAYLYAYPYFSRLNNPNENTRVWMTRSLVLHGEISIDKTLKDWGHINDVAVVGGHSYSSKAPGSSIAGVPVYWTQVKLWDLLGWGLPSKMATTLALRLTVSTLPILAFLWAFARYVKRVTASDWARDLLVVGVGIGSILFPYAMLFVGHATAAALATMGYILVSERTEDGPRARWRWALAGLLTGLAVCFEYQVVLVAGMIAVVAFVLLRWRAIWFALGALGPALALGTHQTIIFGKPWELAQGHMENQAFAAHHKPGFFGLAAFDPEAALSILFAPELGLFVFSPFLLLGLSAGVFLAIRGSRQHGIMALAVFLVMVAFQASLTFWRAGWCAGPRYISVVAPFLAIAIAHAWKLSDTRRWLRWGLGATVVASVALTAPTAVMFPHYPEEFNNPVFDLLMPIVQAGHGPHNLGRLIGLSGAWSMLPWFAVVVGAVLLGLAGDGTWRRRSLRACGTFLAGLVLVAAFSRVGREKSPKEETSVSWVLRSVWEPMD